MNKEKQVSLMKYAQGLRDKLASTQIPVKHAAHPESYKAFLRNEIAGVERTLADAQEAALVGGKK